MAVDASFLTTQVNNIVTQLHSIFDDIGVPNHERESREAEVCTLLPLYGEANLLQLFSALSESLNNHLKLVDE
jgi:protein regulator of cytokinesis 1